MLKFKKVLDRKIYLKNIVVFKKSPRHTVRNIMATCEDFKNIAKNRLKTVDILISNQEWGVAVYLMGFVLECILKASACNTLNLKVYPEIKITKNQQITNYFRTHDFDMLLVVSGMSDIFELSGKGASSWSGFTQEYTKIGKWTDIRYEVLSQFDEKMVRSLYDFLAKEPDGIIPLIKERNVW